METKSLPRRERDKIRQRDEMLAAALELFPESGYHNVSMHQIAQKAEFAIGTLYKFFKNKEDLYKALMMATAERYHRTLKEVLGGKEEVLAVLENYVAAKARIFADNLSALRLYFAETRGASFNIRAGLGKDIRKFYDELVEELSAVFERGVRTKVFHPLDPRHMAVALEGVTNAFLFCWLEDPAGDPYPANIPTIRDIFLRGVLSK